jgi:outer membrane immunogenic protein
VADNPAGLWPLRYSNRDLPGIYIGELSFDDVMNRLIFAGMAAGALLTGPATAADMAIRKAPPPPPLPVSTWTGCYVGAHVGGLWASKEFVETTPDSDFVGQSAGTHEVDSWLGGLQVGCDYQFAGGFVVGIQGDYAWTDAEGSNVSLLFPDFTNQTKIKSLATVTGRIGYAWDRFLGYVKGGGAWERDDHSSSNGFETFAASVTRNGWTVGIGGEYAFTNYLSGFIEYNYYDFGTRDVSFVGNLGVNFTAGIDETKSVVRGGLNLRFGGWGKAPMVARY